MKDTKEKIPFYQKLKEARKNKNISFQDIEEKTKINIRYIKAIEEGDFDILPNTYVRLFIRSYTEILGLNQSEILKEFDAVSLKKSNIPKPLTKAIIKPTSIKSTKSKFNKISSPQFNYFFAPKKIASILLFLFSFLSIYFLVSYLSKIQLNKVSSINLDQSNNNVNLNENYLLNNEDFKSENFIKNFTKKIKYEINIPYVFQITTSAKTKLKISYEKSNNKTNFLNIIAPKDTLIKFENTGNLYFDLWNSNDVQLSINEFSIS